VNALIVILHIIVCLILILVVLLQSGKAADLAGAFGGGGSQTAFGGRGQASLLWIISGKETSSVVGSEKAPIATTVPAQKPEEKAPAAAPAAKPEQKTETQKPPAPAEKK
jgi:preprotein translocase subunit SecG